MAYREDFQPAVYIMANRRNGTLYTGITSDLPQRAWQHREGAGAGFTMRYGCKLLVWYDIGWGYAHRVLDVCERMVQLDLEGAP